MHGGASYGFSTNPDNYIGGTGPVAVPTYAPVPCDGIPGSGNPLNPPAGPADPRAYGFGYSLTPNVQPAHRGGAYSTGNAFPDSCYKAPGSMLPVYNAQDAGYTFRPSSEVNGYRPDGVVQYMDVQGYAARMGGARKTRKNGRKGKKGRKGRKDRKGTKGRKH